MTEMRSNQFSFDETYDIVVIGGGPGGSTVAALVAEKGHRVLVGERAKFPRFHIGESLMPESYWVFERLGMLPRLRDSEFVKKYSVQFITATGRESAPFFFEDRDPRECSQTWQVPRDRFDLMMLDNAREHGATVWEEAKVGDIDRLITRRTVSPEEILDEEIANCPGLEGRMNNAERCAPVQVLSDFSYRATRCAGEGWVLVGDAFGFLDPMYSSGVYLALKSGELAADAINEAFDNNDFSAARLSKWGDTLSRGMTMIRKLVYAFYTKEFSFGRFVKNYPEHKNTIIDLLVGDVFRPEVEEVFKPMSTMAPIPESIPLEKPKELRADADAHCSLSPVLRGEG